MHTFSLSTRALLAALAGLLMLPTAGQARPSADSGEPSAVTVPSPAGGSAGRFAGCSTGAAETDLDINNVRGTLYNIGGLFWRGSAAQYEVPKGSGIVSIFATGIWIGGQLNGDANQLRFAGSTYAPWEFWPGPLDAAGETNAATCSDFDRFWKVNFTDIQAFNGGGTPTADLAGWPIAFGAPFYVDTNNDGRRDPATEPRIELNLGDPGYGTRTIRLQDDERPDITGDQGIWWVMNDNGNPHDWSTKQALELEVRVLAFGFQTADAINNTTFYRYQFIYRGPAPLQNTYVAFFSDPDLGQFNDDYVGSDRSLGLGFVYNGDANDDGGGGYGLLPPALGYDYFQGPLVNNDGIDNDGDGTVDEADERLQVTTFFYFTNGGGPTGDPANTEDRGAVSYTYMQGIWKDGTPMTRGGDGYNPGSTDLTTFAFDGDPPAFWSEYNADGNGRANTPADRRFGVSSGPFTFAPGDIQELVFGIVWSQAPQACQATATPQIASLKQLKFDDITVQGAFNADFSLPAPPPTLNVDATPLDREIVLEYAPASGSLLDLIQYEVVSPFADPSAPDQTYNFEGVEIIQYRNPADQEGIVVQTFDLNNSVTTIIDQTLDCNTGAIVTGVVAAGTNAGGQDNIPGTISITQDAFTQAPLRNNTTYYFGVRPYAYNEASSPRRVFAAPVTRVEARPSLVAPRADGSIIQTPTGTAMTAVAAEANGGQGVVTARVTNPGLITGDTYRVEFFQQTDASGAGVGPNYRIVNATTGAVVFDGNAYYQQYGVVAPQTSNVAQADGLTFDVTGPQPGFTLFTVTDNAAGPLVPPQPGAAHFNTALFPTPDDASPTTGVQQSTNANRWLFFTGGQFASYDEWIDRTTRGGANFPFITPFDYEMRFTGSSIAAKNGIFGQAGADIPVPFELWNTGAGTPDDASDDYKMIPVILDEDDNGVYSLVRDATNATLDSPISGGTDDPYTDWIYWYNPTNTAPGTAGYAAYENGGTVDQNQIADEVFARTSLVSWNGRSRANTFPLPETGTIFRIETTKPNSAGDVFTVNTMDLRRIAGDATTAEDALDLIAITPNPYRGASGYETSGNSYVTRIVNLPAQATVRVFTLSGTLLRTLEKNNPATTTIDWDLRTEAGLPVASGMYLIHVEARSTAGAVIGERVLKFGVVQRRVQLDVL